MEDDQLERLHGEILGCRLCSHAGFIDRAAPVIARAPGARLMLIGQAPGIVELEARRPFYGRAGRELFRWMASIGIAEDEFRNHVYMTSITKCFPGKAKDGAGDRRPSGKEMALCLPFLERQLGLVRPEVILPVGALAIERYFPRQKLADLIGERFYQEGSTVIPLPHPSGASRWLNQPENRSKLKVALRLVKDEWEQQSERRAIAKAATV
ncbi:MAG: uracil-DNA glycosylase [Chloroflexota bacterium]